MEDGNVGRVRREGKQRDPASRAAIRLREELGMTQDRFAKEVLGLSWASVAKYETTHPPKGEQLLRLMDVAALASKAPSVEIEKREVFSRLRKELMHLYIGEFRNNVLIRLGSTGLFARYTDAVGALTDLIRVHSMSSLGIRRSKQWAAFEAVLEESFEATRAPVAAEHKKIIERLNELMKNNKGGPAWLSTNAAKPGGTSSRSAASRSAKAPTRRAARKR
jgi:predicted transcriptional regulator